MSDTSLLPYSDRDCEGEGEKKKGWRKKGNMWLNFDLCFLKEPTIVGFEINENETIPGLIMLLTGTTGIVCRDASDFTYDLILDGLSLVLLISLLVPSGVLSGDQSLQKFLDGGETLEFRVYDESGKEKGLTDLGNYSWFTKARIENRNVNPQDLFSRKLNYRRLVGMSCCKNLASLTEIQRSHIPTVLGQREMTTDWISRFECHNKPGWCSVCIQFFSTAREHMKWLFDQIGEQDKIGFAVVRQREIAAFYNLPTPDLPRGVSGIFEDEYVSSEEE